MPSCELNYAPVKGMHFGFPYCHQGDTLDAEFGVGKSCADYTPPAQKMGAHTAPLGMRFYTGTQFPEQYKNQIFIAQHGSWNRTIPVGYKIMLVTLDSTNKKVKEMSPFASGWLQNDKKVLGRPADVLVAADGSLLVSDDLNGAIYRISYTK
jgi:glucose/arabinose dehydrogenase